MDRMKPIDGLQFEQDLSTNDQVKSMDVQTLASISDRNRLLTLERNSAGIQL
jgi:hypothetical protein